MSELAVAVGGKGLQQFDPAMNGTMALAWLAQFEASVQAHVAADADVAAAKLLRFPGALTLEVLAVFQSRKLASWEAAVAWFKLYYARATPADVALGQLQKLTQQSGESVASFVAKHAVLVEAAGQVHDQWVNHLKAAFLPAIQREIRPFAAGAKTYDEASAVAMDAEEFLKRIEPAEVLLVPRREDRKSVV